MGWFEDMPSLEALAQALILVDPADDASVSDLRDSFVEVASWSESKEVPDEITSAAVEGAIVAEEMCSLSESERTARLGMLGEAFEKIQRCAVNFDPSMRSDSVPAADGLAGKSDEEIAKGEMAGRDAPGLTDDPALVADFLTRAGELLDSLDEDLVVLEVSPARRDVIDDAFRAFHTLKGMAGFLTLTHLQETAHSAEGILDKPRHGKRDLEGDDFSKLFALVDDLREQLAAIACAQTPERTPRQDPGAASVVPSEGESAAEAAPFVERRSTVRVNEARLDRLLDAIGEMVIAESMACESARTAAVSEQLVAQHARLDKITRELQELATSLRMMPLVPTFRRMKRLVRDLAHDAGKDVELRISGEQTELDKEMVDRIGDPLIHLLRNAVDHGIEPRSQRSGKPPMAHIDLRAFHEGGAVVIEVEDDGRGLDAEAVRERALEQELITPDAVLAQSELLELIMAPGFSTAKKVTGVSGRGVGMDVVRREVEALRGRVQVTSEPGKGTRFTLRLPLTLAIIDGMIVQVSEERYIVPTMSIQRTVRPQTGEVSRVLGRGEMLALEDGTIPMIHLGGLFESAGDRVDPQSGVVIICEAAGRRVGLVANGLIGQQQTVIKGLGDELRDIPGLAGGAIMADGRVGLILDVAGLVTLAHNGGGE